MIIFSAQADAELDELTERSLKSNGPKATQRYVAALDSRLRLLECVPSLGRPADKPNLLYWRSGRHFVYFERTGDRIFVVSIVHEKRHPKRHHR